MTYGFVTLTANIAYYILAKELVKANKGHEKALKEIVSIDWFECVRNCLRVFSSASSRADRKHRDSSCLDHPKSYHRITISVK